MENLLNNFKEKIHQLFNEEERKLIDLALDEFTKEFPDNGELLSEVINVTDLIVNYLDLRVNSIVATILYPVFRNNDRPLDIFKDQFPPTVIQLLSGFRRIENLYPKGSDIAQYNFRQLLLNLVGDIRVLLIKMAYQFNLLKQYEAGKIVLTDRRQIENTRVYVSLAHRLGLYVLKTDLEDVLLKVSNPTQYLSIQGKLKDSKIERDQFIDEFSEPIKNKLNESGLNFEIKGRTKSIHSILSKIQKQNVEFAEVFDVFAIRIIIDTTLENEKSSCWTTYSIVTDLYEPNPKRLRDWISSPRPSGYESLHTTVKGPGDKWVEIQIRSKRMDEIAELGSAAHWKYKDGNLKGENQNWLTSLRTLLDQKETSSSSISSESDKIYVFTPDRDLKQLNAGSTLLDFAFEVHTHLGLTCKGGNVNGRYSSLRQELKNGDIVEIVSSKNQKPNKDWLNYANSARTKNKIRRALKEAEHNQIEIGKEILQKKMDQNNLTFSHKNLDTLIKYFKLKDVLNLYSKVGEDGLESKLLKTIFKDNKSTKAIDTTEDQDIVLKKKRAFSPKARRTSVKLEDGSTMNDFEISKCCSPIPGDDIFGFITISKGIKLHRNKCPNAKGLKSNYPYRVLRLEWNKETEDSYFNCLIKVRGADRLGMVNDLTEVISTQLQINIDGLKISRKDHLFEARIELVIQSNDELLHVMKRLNSIKGVESVKRVMLRS